MKYFDPSVSALRLFVRIVAAGKLTTAAAQLHMSQSAASHALSSLEAQVGTPLFVREREGLRLSESGLRLYPAIEAAVAGIDRIRAEAGGLVGLQSGHLRIAAVPSLLATILPPMLREYTLRYPAVELSAFEGTDDEVQAWVKSGLAHIGFAALPVEGVQQEPIARDEWLALVHTEAFPGKRSLTLRELARARFLMSGGGCERHILRMFTAAGIAIAESMVVKQMPTIHAMVSEDLGVSLIPRLSLAAGDSCKALPLRPRLFRNIGMLRALGYVPLPAVEAWQALVRSGVKRAAPLRTGPVNKKTPRP